MYFIYLSAAIGGLIATGVFALFGFRPGHVPLFRELVDAIIMWTMPGMGEFEMNADGRITGEKGGKPRTARFTHVGALLFFLAFFALAVSAEAKTYAYVFNVGSGDVSIIDTTVNEVVETKRAGLRIAWFSSRYFDGKRIWATDARMNRAEVVVFDPWTLKVLKRIPFGKGPSFSVELTPDRRFAIAHAAGSNEVVVIDAKSYEIVRRIPTGRFPCDLTLSLDGRLAYEPDRDQDTLSVIDWRSGKTLRTIPFQKGSKPHMLTLSPDGSRLWVQEREAFKVSVYETKTFTRLARLEVGNRPATNEFTPDGRHTLVTHIGDEVVKVFDVATHRLLKTIRTDKGPVNSAFRPDGKYAYVTNRDSDTVSVIDTSTWDVVKTLPVGRSPFGIYLFNPTKGVAMGNR